MKRNAPKIILAWAVGIVVYMIAAIATGVIDGAPACLCQPAMAFVFSGIFILLAYLVRLPISLLHLDRHKRPLLFLNIALLTIGLVLLLFSQQLGVSYLLFDSMTGEYFNGPNPIALIIGYFMIILAIINW